MKITAYEVRPDEKDYLLAAAQQEQIEITLVQGPMTQDNIDRAEGADGITILGDTKMDAALIEETAKRRIRVVATRTIGYHHIDLNAAKSNGVHVCNGYYDPDGVAEYTVMLILMSLRNYKQALFRGNANDYSLGGLIGRELRNLTVGIIGTGKIGQKVAQNLQGFGCRILAYRNMAYLRQFPNVTMTQHIAFYTEEAVKSMAESGIVNVVKCLKKQDNPNLIC